MGNKGEDIMKIGYERRYDYGTVNYIKTGKE
jgi:hypothetical protein